MAEARPEAEGHSSWNASRGDEIVPHCTIQSSLGGGKRFEVFVAWDRRMLIPVVLKVLRPDLVQQPRIRRSLRREAELLQRLDHPFLVRGFRSDVTGPRPYLTLERVPGPVLSTLLDDRRPLALPDALNIGMALASALHYLHESDVAHLDVKASNVIMGRVPTLIDLSLARSADDAAALTTTVGTSQYMAPEQCDPQNRGRPGTPSDMWGLAVVLHQILAGRRPFRSGSKDEAAPLAERYPQLVREPDPLPDDTPPELVDLLAACLNPVPSQRPDAATAFEVCRRLAGVDPALAPTSDSSVARPAVPGTVDQRAQFEAALRARQGKGSSAGPRRSR